MRDSEPMFRSSFDTDPTSLGWRYVGDAPYDPIIDRGYRGANSLLVKQCTWESPTVAIEPFEYYKVTFDTRAKGPAWWGAIYFDKDGQPLVADHYWGIDPSDDWATTVYCTEGRIKGTHLRIRFEAEEEPFDLGCLRVEHITRSQAAEWGDALYSTIPPVNYTPPVDRWQHIPKTMKALRNGGTTRIVMLGDSICNDTSNGPFGPWIERNYPGARLEIIRAVEGGRGCWFYRDENRVMPYVVDFNPDLFIVAGISHNNNIDAVRDVVGQVREKIDPEIMFMSPCVSDGNDALTGPDWTLEADPAENSFRSRFSNLAQELGCEFLDMTGAWGSYVAESGKPVTWYRRDPIHANARGAAVLSKVIERYFSPK